MMSSLEAYEKLLLKVNRNDSNSNINVPRGKFVVIYNEQAPKWLSEKLQHKLSTDELDELNDLLEDDVELTKIAKHSEYVYYEVPEDFFKVSSSYSVASRDGCTRTLTNWNTKSTDVRVLLNDKNNDPSFDYEETLLTIARNKAKVFFSDFKLEKVFLSYYRLPGKIDVEGYIKVDGSQSSSINPDISDANVDEIISRCAAEIMRNNQNPEGLQLAKDRIPFE